MLASFVDRTHFCLLTVTLYVDCEKREASLDISYKRKLFRVNEPIRFDEVRSPEMARDWLHTPAGQHHTRIEHWEYMLKSGIWNNEISQN